MGKLKRIKRFLHHGWHNAVRFHYTGRKVRYHNLYMKKFPAYYVMAHRASFKNRRVIEKKEQLCGCYDCCRLFRSNEISGWMKEIDGKYTAVCPKCGTDSVICESSGFPITHDFMKKMHEYWF